MTRISSYPPALQLFNQFEKFSKKNVIYTIVAIALVVIFAVKVVYPVAKNFFNSRNPTVTDQPHHRVQNPFSTFIERTPGNDFTAPQRTDENITFEELVENTHSFELHTPIPTQHNRIEYLVSQGIADQTTIVQQANSVRPIIHQKTMMLIEAFLDEKKRSGSTVEKALYREIDTELFIDRLLTKRPMAFLTSSDDYLLKNQVSGSGGFQRIGKENEQPPLCIQDYLSYDEMAISALIGVSCPTYFINEGARCNQAILSHADHQKTGIYVGLVGARFEKPGLMDWQHMIITPAQNTLENGYGTNSNPYLNMWSDFYGYPFPAYEELYREDPDQFLLVGRDTYLNIPVYKERIRMVIEPFLEEANHRAFAEGKKAYVHAVGIGLGVWQICPEQQKYMLEVYEEVLNRRSLPHIGDIDYSYFLGYCGGIRGPEKLYTPVNEVTIHFSIRNPAEKLLSDDQLLVAAYAWDANSFPGNEYWMGSLSDSGDPAAACCSTIPQLQNPLINTALRAKKLHVVS